MYIRTKVKERRSFLKHELRDDRFVAVFLRDVPTAEWRHEDDEWGRSRLVRDIATHDFLTRDECESQLQMNRLRGLPYDQLAKALRKWPYRR